ncbi:MAG: DUF4111 domain-containing protein [Treponema sp.]|nr:DUF4111 domain-containing protein [Treponema sp.]
MNQRIDNSYCKHRYYQTLPAAVKTQIEQVKNIWLDCLGNSLIGIYIHGSIALESFNEQTSDIDLLIISERRIPRGERLLLAAKIIDIDHRPSPLEMSAIKDSDLKPWKHPARCQFHYSGAWTAKYKQMLSDLAAGCFTKNNIVDTDFPDPDITCHVRLAKQCGVCVYGPPPAQVFPGVPEADFWDSLTYDINESDISTLGRVLSYKHEKKILSKQQSAVWLKNYLQNHYPHYTNGLIDSDELKQTLINEITN